MGRLRRKWLGEARSGSFFQEGLPEYVPVKSVERSNLQTIKYRLPASYRLGLQVSAVIEGKLQQTVCPVQF
jgi:hypothetical protein